MRIERVEVNSIDLVSLGTYLKDKMKCHYARSGTNMFVLASEKYYMRIDSTQLNLIVAKIENDKILIDIIGGGGGKGFFNFNWGSERNFVNKTVNCIKTYSEEILHQIV